MKPNFRQRLLAMTFFSFFVVTFLFNFVISIPVHYFIMKGAIDVRWLTTTIISSLLFSLVFTSTTRYAGKKIKKTQRN